MSRSSERPNSIHKKRDSLRSESLSSLPENPIHPTPPRAASRTSRYELVTPGWNPETPTTEFEDTPITPGETSPQIPNILVLGTENTTRASAARWSSTSSAYSAGSNKSSSTITSTTKPDEDANLTRLKVLILKAAMNVGFSRTPSAAASVSSGSSKADSGPPALPTFVKSLPPGSFGSLPAHASLLSAYRNLVLSDPTFRSAHALPSVGKKASAVDVAKSVGWMMRSGQYTFLKDLFRLVFGFHLEEAEKRKSVTITV
jgi:hypothetical protein